MHRFCQLTQSARCAAQSPRIERVRTRDGSRPRRRHGGLRAGGRIAAGRAAAGLGAWLGTHARNLLPLAEAMRRWAARCCSICRVRRLAAAAGAWGTEDYADAIAEFLAAMPAGQRASGSGIRSAAASDCSSRRAIRRLVDGLFLIAAAGLPRTRSLPERVADRGAALAFRRGAAADPRGTGARRAARTLRQRRLRAAPGRCGRSWSRRSARI